MSAIKAMILAAGRGERMRPLTDTVPKPLLSVRGRPLIEHSLRALSAAGVQHVVVNLSYRGAQIHEHLGDGSKFGVRLAYSEEGEPPLETGGGVFKALPLLGADPFVLVNADVYSEYSLGDLVAQAQQLPADALAHLVLVPNPAHHPLGDFGLSGNRVNNTHGRRHTFSGLSVQRPELLKDCRPGRFPMLPLWRAAADAGRLAGELYRGLWSDVGTPHRLAELEKMLGSHV
jgi:MurNAc alpha-1-phosphate uridylyltransferase